MKWLDLLKDENELRLDCHRAALDTLWARLQRQLRVEMNNAGAVVQLQRENAELKLYVAALARILIAKGVCTVAELTSLLDIVDGEDGALDGKLTGRPLPGQKPRLPKPPKSLRPPRKKP